METGQSVQSSQTTQTSGQSSQSSNESHGSLGDIANDVENEVSHDDSDDSRNENPKPSRKEKIKIFGEEVELPWEEIKRRAEEASGAQERFRKAAEMQKQAQRIMELYEQQQDQLRYANQVAELISNLSRNPESIDEFFEALGIDADDYYEKKFIKKLQREAMPEHERRLLEIQEENERIKSELEKIRQQEEFRRKSEMEALHIDESMEEFRNFWVGKDYTLEEVRATLKELLIDDSLTIEQAHRKALNDLRNYHKAYLSRVQPDDIPESVRDSLRRSNIEKAKQYSPRRLETGKQQSKEKMSFDDFFKMMDQK